MFKSVTTPFKVATKSKVNDLNFFFILLFYNNIIINSSSTGTVYKLRSGSLCKVLE